MKKAVFAMAVLFFAVFILQNSASAAGNIRIDEIFTNQSTTDSEAVRDLYIDQNIVCNISFYTNTTMNVTVIPMITDVMGTVVNIPLEPGLYSITSDKVSNAQGIYYTFTASQFNLSAGVYFCNFVLLGSDGSIATSPNSFPFWLR